MLIALITFPPFLFYSFLLCCSLLFSIRSLFLFLFWFDWFGFLSFLSVKVVAVSLRWDDESFVLESFNLYSLLLSCFPSPHTRSSCSSSSDVLPMYYSRVVYSFTLPLVCVCVCAIYHRTRAGKSEDEFENYSNRWDRSSCQRILWNRMGYTHPFSNREFFRFFVFLFLSVSFRELRHIATPVEWNATEREREKQKKTTFFSLFLEEANTYVQNAKEEL